MPILYIYTHCYHVPYICQYITLVLDFLNFSDYPQCVRVYECANIYMHACLFY